MVLPNAFSPKLEAELISDSALVCLQFHAGLEQTGCWETTVVKGGSPYSGGRGLSSFYPWTVQSLIFPLTLGSRGLHECTLSHFSRAQLRVTLWTVALQAPLSMGFFRQECWSGLPCPPPGDLPDPQSEPESLKSPAVAAGFFTTSATWEVEV